MKKLILAFTVALFGATTLLADLTARSYITDGLIGHWDGVYNVGYGEAHADTASVWTELSGKSESIPVPEGASFAANGLTTVREHGSVVVAGTADSPAGTSASVLLDAFKSAKYTVEIAYNQPEAIPNESGFYFNRLWRAFVLGSDWYNVGSQFNTRVGFNPNDTTHDDNDLLKFVTVSTTVGQHSFSCRQDGTAASVTFDGDIGASWTVVTEEAVRPRGVKFNRSASVEGSGLSGTYHSIRFYNRPLTAEESAVNYAVDQVRFFGADPAKLHLPEGWRFDTTDGVKLEKKTVVAASSAAAGTVRIGEGEAAARVDVWNEWNGELTAVTITAKAETGWRFHHWNGPLDDGVNRLSATIETKVADDLEAVFVVDGANRLTAKSYVQSGLISHYDGEENVAYGAAHSADATTWADLTGRGIAITVPQGASFVSDGLQTIRAYGSAMSGASTLLNMFKSAKFTMEFAYNKTKETPKSTSGSAYAVCRMFILGAEKFMVGTDGDTKFGFNANTDAWQAEYQIHRARTAATTVGNHTFSCLQDGADWKVTADGESATGTGLTPYAEPPTGHGVRFNRGYYEDYGLDGTYYDIRFYGRPLMADEIAVNQAIDQVRFFGADPNVIELPEGWRFDTTDGVKLECRYAIASSDAAGGSVSVNGGNPSDIAYVWGEQNGAPVRATIKADAADGYEFAGWVGNIGEADPSSEEIVADVSADVKAVFRRAGKYRLSAKSYVTDGLIGHWDGESNVGYDQPHDNAAAKWKDLTGKFVDINLQTGFAFSSKGLKTVRAYGFGGRNNVRVERLDKIVQEAHYTTEIAYNQPKPNTTSSEGYHNTRCSMLLLSDNKIKVGTDKNSLIGMQPNLSSGVSEYELLYGPTFTDITGMHTFSCRQSPTTVKVDVDGTASYSRAVTPNFEHTVRQGFGFNRDYYDCGLDGTYYDVRIYDRALTDDEVYVNRAIDQIRFFGADPADYTMPEGWRFDTTDGIRLDWRRTVTAAAGGTIEVDGQTVDGSAPFWCEKGGWTEVAVSATPAEGYEFAAWSGEVNPADIGKQSGTIRVSGDFRPRFRRLSYDAVRDGLVYDMSLDLATPGETATKEKIYNALANSGEGGRQTAVAVAAPYAGSDQEHIPELPGFVSENASLQIGAPDPLKAIYFPFPTYTNDQKQVKMCGGGVRLADDCVDGDQSIHVRFRWEGPSDANQNIYPIPLVSSGLDTTAGAGFGVGLYYAKAATDSAMIVVRAGKHDFNHGGGDDEGITLTRFKVMRNTWYDLVVTVKPHYDGRLTYSFYIGNAVDVKKDLFEFSGTFTNSALEKPSPSRYLTIATPVAAGGNTDWNGGYNNFRGSISNVRVWNRVLTKQEALMLMADATGSKWTIGVKDGTADEFAAIGSDEAVGTFDPYSMAWRRFPKALTAEKPSVTVKCRLNSQFMTESGHVKFLTVEPVLASLPASASVKVLANGAEVKTIDLNVEDDRTVGLRKGFVRADANGDLAITLTRVGDMSEPLELDALSLSGGLQIGVPVEVYSGDEFKATSSAQNQFTVGCTNVMNALLYVDAETVCSQQKIVFDVPKRYVGLGGLTFTSRIKNVYSNYKPFSVHVNGVQVFSTSDLAVRDTFTVDVPPSALKAGLNELSVRIDTTKPYWYTFDYYNLQFKNVFDVPGAMFLVR